MPLPLLHLDWMVCDDHYRVERRPSKKGPTIAHGDSGGTFIVPNSDQRRKYTPLTFPALYRQLANCPPDPEGLLRFINLYGFLHSATAKEENFAFILGVHLLAKQIVEAMDDRDWQAIKKWLAQNKVGNLAVDWQFEPGSELPQLLYRPPNLASGLYVQALDEASHGEIDPRKCKNPTCRRYLPYSLREDAKYHSEACQKEHAYAKKKKARLNRKARKP